MDKEEIIKQIEGNLVKLSEKDFGIYFFTADTKGAPTASIANIYEHVKMLNELGYKAYVLHEKNDLRSPSSSDELDEDAKMEEAWTPTAYHKIPILNFNPKSTTMLE